ncbi:unnamed protein product [Kuraishia capsulata CBS 1993]|uniref:Ribonuclease H n=1 Tax=Kuraishia capsulata CBS 1993 TaxID=1382522 RepID=W6MPF4_9ASCO|nr:uncharacterized protein KUCA_T00004489001 [Kuraishia capsulata CBS 1993]CDK28506.1 unnamed protein product [Kuraishia capsulata CBS 1993]
MGKSKGGYYAVRNGRSKGVYNSWSDCLKQVTGYSNASFKKFDTMAEASAFVSGGSRGGSARASTAHNSPSNGPYSLSSSRSYALSYAQRSPGQVSKSLKATDATPDGASTSPQTVDHSKHIYVDGAARGNGRGNARGGAGIYYGPGDPRNKSIPLPDTTNQKAELLAMREGLKGALKDTSNKYTIHSDSQYAIKSSTIWYKRWEENGWKNTKGEPVANKELVQDVVQAKRALNDVYESKGWGKVEIKHVNGHSGDPGNDAADALANRGADAVKD